MSTETLGTSSAAELLEKVEHGYLSTRAILDTIADDRFDERLPSGMTLRQVLAHLAAWEETVPPRVALVLETGEDSKEWEDVDGYNARIFAETRDTAITALRERYARSHTKLTELLRSFVGRDVPPLALQVVEWNTTGHYPDHFADLGAATKDAKDVLAAVKSGRRRFKAGVNALGLVGLDRTTPSGWTYKEMLAHVAEWEELTRRRLAHLRATDAVERLEAASADDLNREFTEGARAKNVMDVLTQVDAAHERLVAEIALLTPQQLDAHEQWAKAVIAGNTYGHYAEHHVELFAALPRTAAEILARFDASWAITRARIREIGRAGLMEPTPASWTYRDLLAHLANWMQQAVRELEGGELVTWTQDRIDAENERAVQAHQLVGAEAMLDELDSSQRRVRETIARLSDERLADRRVWNVAAFYTYLAWEEHFAEMGIQL